ncbi:MoaD/ThiS family protein [Nocardioides nanhaiensis]|uniref:MoaD/ThiS family protein n=1 Tax=Nocardioides nanhaiensis TaxID=1476871 RepID=A0ABP8VWL0_9ACTN
MAVTAPLPAGSETGVIRVNYWAAARAAAGVAHDDLPAGAPMTLAEVLAAAVALHPGTRLPDVVGVCSVLVGEQPVGTEDPGAVVVEPGDVVELLPPFAGG